MHRAVLDANVYVSAIIRPEGPPGLVVGRFLRDAAFDIVLSPAVIGEVQRAFAYPKVQRFIRGDVDPELWFEDVVILADLVADVQTVSGVCADSDDDKYLDAALEGRAGFLVTGDRQLLAVGQYEGVRIVGPRAFLEILDTDGPAR